MLEVLKDKTEVQCRQLSNKEYVLYGTFKQIFYAQTLLQDILQRRSSVLHQSKKGNDALHQVDTTQTQQNSSEMWAIDNYNTGDVSSFEVQPEFMKFLKQVYKNKLQEIEETHGVDIIWSENASQVQIHSRENNPHSYQEGCNAFIDLYQKLYPTMSREVLDLKSADSRASVIEAIQAVERENQVIIEIKGNKLLLFAEKNNIASSVQALKEKLGSLQGSSRKTNANRSVREHGNFLEDRLQQLLSHGMKFVLYQSDITDERVDAIVNAANDGLQHGGGVAAAIVRKGGRQIEEESRQIMFSRNYRPLNVGDAVYTRGGNLCCQFVIHTVGPRWNAHEGKRCTSLLRRACVESLRLAAKLELCSIALPAISSGIFGMPKSICAQVMFQAVEEFSSSTDAEFSTLRDVRIVIIDDETINVFREVFVKRYTSPETSSTTSPYQERRPRPSSEEQESSSALNVVANGPAFSSADNLSDRPSKKTGEDNDSVESPNEGVDPNADNNEVREQTPDGIKEGHSAKKNIAIVNKGSPNTDIETSNVDTEVNAVVKGSELSKMTASVKPPRGREIAANFSGKSNGEAGCKSSGSTQLSRKTGEEKSLNTGRGRGMTHAATKSPPGLTVTEEGQFLAQDHTNRVKGDQNTDPAKPLINEKEESEKTGSNDGAIEDKDQELRGKYNDIDEDKLNDMSGSKLPPNGGMTDQEETRPSNEGICDSKKAEETKKNTVEKPLTHDERQLPTNENIYNPTETMQPDNRPETGMQADQSGSSEVNNVASYPEEQLPPDDLEMSPAAEAMTSTPIPAPTTPRESVTVLDTVKERQAAGSDAGEKKYSFILLSVKCYC